MEFLLDNPLAAMEGTLFLVLYSIVILTSIATLAYFKHTLDQSDNLGTPTIPPEIDPFETAYLRGGMNELARTVVFAIRQKGFITIAKSSKVAYLLPVMEKPDTRLAEIERRAVDWIGAGREVRDVFTAPSALIDALAVYASAYRAELERRQLLTSNEARSVLRRRKWFTAAFIAALGTYKVLVGLATENFNVLFTIGFASLGLVAVFLVGRERRQTKLGQLYLERLRAVFQPLRSNINDTVESAGVARVDPLLLSVGIFGGVALAGTAFYDHNEAFEKSQRYSNASGGGCGASACGGASSSTAGGSSCASGCGGCSGGGGCGGGGCGGS